MASRMEKYHSGTSQSGTRSVRNESLYKDIYENAEYSNCINVEIDLLLIINFLKFS